MPDANAGGYSMKHFNAQTIFMLVALVCLSAVGCSPTKNERSAASARTEIEVQTRVALEDGVYPVVLAGEAMPKAAAESKVVELINVPVEGSGASTSDKVRVIPRPLLRFRKLSHFDFTFQRNECTEVGFQNTAELKAYTRDHVGARLAVVIDNKVISHHKIREAIESDEVRITCCTVGGGDHLHKHLIELKLASKADRRL
jgi:preprotein translocase subunit SecD